MDDSADFQEKKKKFVAGNNKNKKNTDNKKKKTVKKLKGQKDIRVVLNPKKNDLVRYSKDFNEVCKLSGIDVDSEQLQIAIALSKSLQNCQSDSSLEAHSSKCDTQDNSSKIRNTLQEYGFKVPEVKIEKKVNRRKKTAKNYKLLTVSAIEKDQIIADKYSQVLFKNLHSSEELFATPSNDKHLYYIATNISYTEITDDSVFYVEGLLKKYPNSVGSLLKDWSTIPGRPESPCYDINNKYLRDINYSQDELDKILSGNLKTVQSFMKRNNFFLNQVNMDKDKGSNCRNKEYLSVNNVLGRSCSPDIFDDEVSSILENSYENKELISTITTTTFNYNNDVMDLTKCVQQSSGNVTNNILFQGIDVTKRKSNDLMELTDCVTSGSQPILIHSPVNINGEELRPSIIENNDIETSKLSKVLNINNCSVEIKEEVQIDLTHDISINSKCTIYNGEMKELNDKMDLTQSSDSFEAFPIVNLKPDNDISPDDTIILEEKDYTHVKSPIKLIHIESDEEEVCNRLGPTDIKTVYSSKEEILDFTLEIQKTPIMEIKDDNITPSKMIENEYHCKDHVAENEHYDLPNETDHIDLTQNLDRDDSDFTSYQSAKTSFGSLGKKDNISVDYDEILYDHNSGIIEYNPEEKSMEFCPIISENHSKLCEEIYVKSSSNQDTQSNYNSLSQNSEVFQISDNELDYSMHQSRLEHQKENFEIGGISILDNNSKIGKSFCSNRISKSISESFLPEVDIIKRPEPMSNIEEPPETVKSKPTTPLKYLPNCPIVTPKGEYIIKTDGVTPILDYASLSTPERNNELEKYGLKPFKRKRAIQLLTHLYNQTHPLMETCIEELPSSPSKKLKPDINSEQSKETKIKFTYKNPVQQKLSPKKMNESPQKHLTAELEGSKDAITNDIMNIGNAECDSDDWVFQKREKSKVHSCRLPLHIAFHNYLSCRKGLQEAILRYEPVHIDVIHKDLAAQGLKYDPKDLLKFLDKKCITVKTADNSSRNMRK